MFFRNRNSRGTENARLSYDTRSTYRLHPLRADVPCARNNDNCVKSSSVLVNPEFLFSDCVFFDTRCSSEQVGNDQQFVNLSQKNC